MLNQFFVPVLVLTILIMGCSTPGVRLTVTSEPDGAYITSEGPVSGIVPVVAFWEMKYLEKSSRDPNGCFQLGGFTARWASGAVTEVPVLQHCGEADGDYTFVMSRNMNVPGLDKDMKFALEVQAIRAQKTQAESAQSAAYAALLSGAKFSQPTPRPSYCSTYRIGNTFQTNCQ